MCFKTFFKTIKIICFSYIWCNLFQSLGAHAINDLSPKVFLVIVLGGYNRSSD